MPIDTPYNRMIADQYNAMNRAKVAYVDNNYIDTVGSPAGYATTGYEPRRVGSGVGMYKKTAECPKGHEVCNCGMGSGNARGAGKARGNARGGNNIGLNPNVRASLALGAGLKATTTQRHGTLDQKQMTNAMSAMESLGSGEAHGISATLCGRGNARGNARGPARGKAQGGDLKDWWEKGKKAVEVGKQIYDVGKKAYDVGKEGYDLYKKVRGNGGTGGYVPTQQQYHSERHRGRVAHGEARGEAHGEAHGKKVNKRAVVVKKIMKEKGLSMIEASKYVKAHNLY
jgi:hypothetical protein